MWNLSLTLCNLLFFDGLKRQETTDVLDLKISCILVIELAVILLVDKYTGISAKTIVAAIANRINPRQQIATIG
jgi:hypothetical protein